MAKRWAKEAGGNLFRGPYQPMLPEPTNGSTLTYSELPTEDCQAKTNTGAKGKYPPSWPTEEQAHQTKSPEMKKYNKHRLAAHLRDHGVTDPECYGVVVAVEQGGRGSKLNRNRYKVQEGTLSQQAAASMCKVNQKPRVSTYIGDTWRPAIGNRCPFSAHPWRPCY